MSDSSTADSGSQITIKKSLPLTLTEKEYLRQLVQENIKIIESKNTDFGTRSRKKVIWDHIATKFSSQEGMSLKSASQLKKCWANSKRIAKKAVSEIKIQNKNLYD